MDLETLPVEVFNLCCGERLGRMCKLVPLPWQGREGQWHLAQRECGLGPETKGRAGMDWQQESLAWFSCGWGSVCLTAAKKKTASKGRRWFYHSQVCTVRGETDLEQPWDVELWPGAPRLKHFDRRISAGFPEHKKHWIYAEVLCVSLLWYVAHIFPCWNQW